MLHLLARLFDLPKKATPPHARELAHIKALLHKRPESILFSHVYPPVSPPPRYHVRPELVAGRRVPLTRQAAAKWKTSHRFLAPIPEEVAPPKRRPTAFHKRSCGATDTLPRMSSSFIHFDIYAQDQLGVAIC
ncbi:Aste57867_17241 [Aphanomyces stellatus]|uniref:Aste57867_17241 protein n=1 Tax=Aphanomyces stellatus TaxID=120398 RepID=A0A485L7E7_9STRA|nr:hypothetical protein As57867_017182 [Aphanomyces stellatus]VFT93997.1 Aste57867_17241 [Aphanomyces stellatus]